jgi:signal transduction histidine kinase
MTEMQFSQFAPLLAAALLIPSFIFLAYGVSHRNMKFWWVATLAYFLMFFGSVVATSRSLLPEVFVDLIANAIIGAGYLVCMKSVRMVKNFWRFYRTDYFIYGLFVLTLIFVISFDNSYQARVSTISTVIFYFSFLGFFATFGSSTKISKIGDTALLVFTLGNAIFAGLRGSAAALDSTAALLRLSLWDQIFFVWSISSVFCFAIGLFLNGLAQISAETYRQLEKERLLGKALSEALDGQRNLKKLILHELKRPLGALTTTVDTSRQKQNGMLAEEVDDIYRLTQAANEYLRGVADYEDINAVFETPTLVNVPLIRLIEDIENKWKVKVELNSEVKDIHTNVDLLLFDVAIGNLIENAQKHGLNRDNVAVGVEVCEGTANFNVFDDGPGIPPEEQEKVFQQFYKIEGVETNAIKGCGLGLYVTRRIAETLGGNSKVLAQTPSIVSLILPITSNMGCVNASKA